MFVRRTKTFSSSKGPGYTFRLCQSVRSGSRVRQLTLLNLGVHFDIPPQQWREFASLVDAFDQGQQPLAISDPALIEAARNTAERLRERRLAKADSTDAATATVDLDSIEHQPTRSVGGERLALAALDQLRFRPALLRQGLSGQEADLAASLVVARMLSPSSERAAHGWLARRSATWELLGLAADKSPSLTSLYRVGDRLWHKRVALETALARRERSVFDLPATIAFHDLTNVHCHLHARGIANFGRSKQRRNDCPLVTLALSLDEAGFPRCSEVLPGNVAETATLKDALRRLQARTPPSDTRPLVVFDAGISSQENLDWLRSKGYDWITVRRNGRAEVPREPAGAEFETRSGRAARVWELPADDEGEAEQACERRLLLWSQQREKQERDMLGRARERFEKELAALHRGLTTPRCIKRHDRVLEKVGRLKQRHRRVASQYEIVVHPAPRGAVGAAREHASAVTWKHNDKGAARDASAGTCQLRTSCRDWDLERVVRTYWRLAEIEATFRQLKSELGLRPIWHRKPDRIRAHLFIAVLAAHAVHFLRRKLAVQGIHDSWATIRRQCAGWERVTTQLRTVDGRLIENRQDSLPRPEAARIARAVGVVPGRHRKRV